MKEDEIDLKTLKLTIDQLSELTDVPKQTLRYWEKNFSDYLRPSRSVTMRRRYGLEDLEMVRIIKRLIEEEFLTREGVKRRLEDLFPKSARTKDNATDDFEGGSSTSQNCFEPKANRTTILKKISKDHLR